MPQLNTVVLTDRAAAPVAHTFTPQGKEGDGARLAKAGSSPVADRQFHILPRVTPNGRRKVELRLAVPQVQTQTVNGIASDVIVRTSRVSVTFDFAADSTVQERKDLVGMIQSGLLPAATVVDKVLVDGENIW